MRFSNTDNTDKTIDKIYGVSQVLNTSLRTCHNLWTPEALHTLTRTDASVLTSVGVKPLVDLNFISKLSAMPVLRKYGLPYGLYNSLCTLHLLCSGEFHPLRHRCNTRYGWLVRPCPTGTCTLQDVPSFAWHTNVASTGLGKLAACLRFLQTR